MARIILVALVVLCCAALGAAIDCYSCTGLGNVNNNCNDPFSKATIEIKSGCQSCSKSVATLAGIVNTGRSCESTKHENGCVPAAVAGNVCYCNGNTCNGVGKSAAATGVIFVSLTAMFLRV